LTRRDEDEDEEVSKWGYLREGQTRFFFPSWLFLFGGVEKHPFSFLIFISYNRNTKIITLVAHF